MDTVTATHHSFHLSVCFLQIFNLDKFPRGNFQEELIYHLAEARVKTTK